MAYTEQDKLTALAGIYQAALCVQQIARQGSVDTGAMEPCIYSLFQTDADSVSEIFGAPGSLGAGARELLRQLTGKQPREVELARYAISMLKSSWSTSPCCIQICWPTWQTSTAER